MNKVVISQPMFFPWVGLFEQIKLADVYVHLDDVQFPLGRSFTNRVQIKTHTGIQWLTVPVQRKSFQNINEVLIDGTQNWKQKHLNSLEFNYRKSPYFKDMMQLVEDAYSLKTQKLAELNIYIIEKVACYFDLSPIFVRSSSFGVTSHGSERLLEILNRFNADIYITGHGASNYLDHEKFEAAEIKVEYMDYNKSQYRQLHGDFNPYVSSLDLISNEGKKGKKCIIPRTKFWRDFI